jgi:hypothetical protein
VWRGFDMFAFSRCCRGQTLQSVKQNCCAGILARFMLLRSHASKPTTASRLDCDHPCTRHTRGQRVPRLGMLAASTFVATLAGSNSSVVYHDAAWAYIPIQITHVAKGSSSRSRSELYLLPGFGCKTATPRSGMAWTCVGHAQGN